MACSDRQRPEKTRTDLRHENTLKQRRLRDSQSNLRKSGVVHDWFWSHQQQCLTACRDLAKAGKTPSER